MSACTRGLGTIHEVSHYDSLIGIQTAPGFVSHDGFEFRLQLVSGDFNKS
jgi:hypothetical protein